MKLKSFEKVRLATCTEYVVFNGDNPAILKRMKYENMGANVRFVDVNSATGNLTVTVDI